MADQDNVTPIEDGKEFNDAELTSIVDKLYGGNNNAPKEEVQEKAPAPEVKSEEPISKEDIHVPSPDLPPGFDPTATKASKDVEQNVDLDDKVIDEAIENAPNDNYKNNMVAMRKSLQGSKEKLANQQKLIDKLKEAGVINDDNEFDNSFVNKDLQSELNQAYDKLGKYDLMQDPRFQSKYNEPIKNQLDAIANVLKSAVPEEDQANLGETVMKMANMSAVERIKFMQNNLPEEYRLAVSPYFAEVDKIVIQRNVALENHKSTLKDIKERQLTEETQRSKLYKEAIKEKTTNEIIADGFKIFERKEGNEEYNQFVDAIYNKANSVFDNNNAEEQAKAMLLGVAAPVYRGMYETTEARLQEALKEIENLKGARASFTGNVSEKSDEATKKALSSNKGIAKMLGKELNLL
jgi:hypothetical protein